MLCSPLGSSGGQSPLSLDLTPVTLCLHNMNSPPFLHLLLLLPTLALIHHIFCPLILGTIHCCHLHCYDPPTPMLLLPLPFASSVQDKDRGLEITQETLHWGSRKVALSVKHLPCQHEDLGSDPKHWCKKPDTEAHIYSPHIGEPVT